MQSTKFISIILLTICSVLFFGCTNSVQKIEGDLAESLYLPHSPKAQYIGKQECKKCHRDKFDTYIHTQMGRSMKHANSTNSSAQWHNQNPIYDSTLNLYYLPYAKEQELFVKEFRLGKSGTDTIHQRIERIDIIVGSGQHTNSHFVSQNGYVHQAPLTWYAQKGEWHLPPGFENGNNTRFSRVIGEECMTCHNGYSDFVKGSKNRYTNVVEGIDCERCHGPGSLHKKEKQSGKLIDVTEHTDYSIVNPAKLSSDLQMDVCERCHLQGVSALNEGSSYKDFIPGMKLSSMYEVYQARFKDSESTFIMASHSDRLQMSPCYLNSRKDDSMHDLTCITCHNPHVSVDEVPSSYFNSKCIECHQTMKCSEQQNTREAQDDNCISCHMKKASSYDIPHVNITDHNIVKNPVSRSVDKSAFAESELEKQKDFLRLICRTNDNPKPLSSAKAYLNYFEKYAPNAKHLDSAKYYLNKSLQPDSILNKYWIRLYFLAGDYPQVVRVANERKIDYNAWTYYRVGQAMYHTGDLKGAVKKFKQAVNLSSGDLDFRNKLASTLVEIKQFNEALQILKESMDLNPEVAETNNLLGFCLVSLYMEGDRKEYSVEAEGYFVKALSLNPDYTKAKENLASLYLNIGNKKKAELLIGQLLAAQPENPAYLKMKKVVSLL